MREALHRLEIAASQLDGAIWYAEAGGTSKDISSAFASQTWIASADLTIRRLLLRLHREERGPGHRCKAWCFGKDFDRRTKGPSRTKLDYLIVNGRAVTVSYSAKPRKGKP